MSRITNFLKLFLPEDSEYYNVEKDQNKNFEKIDRKLEEWDTGKEPAITDKKSGFNLEKTSSIENNSNKLFTAAGAYNLNNKKWDIHYGKGSMKGIYDGSVGIYVGASNEINFEAGGDSIIFNYRTKKTELQLRRFRFGMDERVQVALQLLSKQDIYIKTVNKLQIWTGRSITPSKLRALTQGMGGNSHLRMCKMEKYVS